MAKKTRGEGGEKHGGAEKNGRSRSKRKYKSCTVQCTGTDETQCNSLESLGKAKERERERHSTLQYVISSSCTASAVQLLLYSTQSGTVDSSGKAYGHMQRREYLCVRAQKNIIIRALSSRFFIL